MASASSENTYKDATYKSSWCTSTGFYPSMERNKIMQSLKNILAWYTEFKHPRLMTQVTPRTALLCPRKSAENKMFCMSGRTKSQIVFRHFHITLLSVPSWSVNGHPCLHLFFIQMACNDSEWIVCEFICQVPSIWTDHESV